MLTVTVLVTFSSAAFAQLASEPVVSGLSSPVAFVQDPSRPDVQLVLEQDGRIRVVQNGTLLDQDFLDLTADVLSGGERGLLGLAFAPDYASSGRVYVNFTNTAGNTVIARFLRSTADPLRADPLSRFDLVWPGGLAFIEQPFANHNGGHLAFGPDGYLYIGMGDGGSANDPAHRAQDPQTLLGKMLRIDVSVDATHPTGYVVPPTNPFVTDPAVLDEIWAFGYRNPWRFSFDDPARGGTGAMIVGDVGQAAWEEIDYEPAGAGGRNYGWRNREGAHDNVATLPPFSPTLTDPIFEYPRDPGGGAVTGGFVYRGAALGASYLGRYFFADISTSRVWSFDLSVDAGTGEATAVDLIEHTTELGSGATTVSSFGVDANGELYTVNHATGEIRRIALASGSCTTPQPVADWVCVNGGWLPPELAPGGTPPPPPPPPPTTGECSTPQPVADWVCVNGGWLPPELAPNGAPPPPPPPPPPTTGECTTPQPVSDWVCVNGGWLPPELVPGGTPPPPPPPPPAPSPEACATPDPFVDIPGLVGICQNGGWIATEQLDSSATMRFHAEQGGFWALHLDDGRVFVPMMPVDAVFQVEGLKVAFTGKVRADVMSAQGTIVEIITIAIE
ncbi:MAG TPA: PQQ-dependent sugar dehydrogenase [Vicinamibacterales bacterium]